MRHPMMPPSSQPGPGSNEISTCPMTKPLTFSLTFGSVSRKRSDQFSQTFQLIQLLRFMKSQGCWMWLALIKRSPLRVTTLHQAIATLAEERHQNVTKVPRTSNQTGYLIAEDALMTSSQLPASLSRYLSCCPFRGASCWMLLLMCFLSQAHE